MTRRRGDEITGLSSSKTARVGRCAAESDSGAAPYTHSAAPSQIAGKGRGIAGDGLAAEFPQERIAVGP